MLSFIPTDSHAPPPTHHPAPKCDRTALGHDIIWHDIKEFLKWNYFFDWKYFSAQHQRKDGWNSDLTLPGNFLFRRFVRFVRSFLKTSFQQFPHIPPYQKIIKADNIILKRVEIRQVILASELENINIREFKKVPGSSIVRRRIAIATGFILDPKISRIFLYQKGGPQNTKVCFFYDTARWFSLYLCIRTLCNLIHPWPNLPSPALCISLN